MRVIMPLLLISQRTFVLSKSTTRSLCVRFSKKIQKLKTDDFGLHKFTITTKLTPRRLLTGTSCFTPIAQKSENKRSKQNFCTSASMTSAKGFVNKTLCLESYDIIGFDLDCTLLRYNLNEVTQMEYDVIQRYLVDVKKYPCKFLENKLNVDFVQKGLMVDADRGNLIKISNEGVILRASHGTRPLSDKEIIATYGPDRKWDVSTQFNEDPTSTWNGPASLQLRALLDYFDSPAAMTFAHAVDYVDAEANGVKPEKYTVWADIHEALVSMYTRENYSNGKSEYFTAIRADPSRYILRTSDKVIHWLCALRAAGKKLFLLTGSNVDFAYESANYAFGIEWQKLFDCVVFFAKKPAYFMEQRPYLQVDMEKLAELPECKLSVDEELPLTKGQVYSQGNWQQLHEALSKSLNKDKTKVRALYFGDNLIQDIYSPVQHGDFDAVAVVEELLAAYAKDCEYEYASVVRSKYWGSYFSVNGTPTNWSAIISKHAQLCVPRIEDIIGGPFCMSIKCNNPNGFYPKQPKELDKFDLSIKNEEEPKLSITSKQPPTPNPTFH